MAIVAGTLDALRRVSARSLTLLLSRAEFAALELAQARARVVRWVLLSLVCTAVFQLAALAASAALAAVLWDRYGPVTLAALALVYAGVGAAVLARLRREISQAPALLSETLAELAKDRDALFGDAAAAAKESARDAQGNATRDGPRHTESSP